MAKRNLVRKGAERKASKDERRAAYAAALRGWFGAKKERKQSDMARALGVSEFAVSSWCKGDRTPSGRYPDAIEIYTGKAVKAEGCPRNEPDSLVVPFAASK